MAMVPLLWGINMAVTSVTSVFDLGNCRTTEKMSE